MNKAKLALVGVRRAKTNQRMNMHKHAKARMVSNSGYQLN